MKHIITTKAYFFMKDKIIHLHAPVFLIAVFFTLFIINSCAPSKPSLKALSITEPEKVVSKQDSLLALSKEKRPEFVAILSTAHINIARKAEKSGILAPLAGTLWLVILTAFCTIPLGISTALYLEEFAGTNMLSKLIKINISNLAGVPSIIYGLLGLAFLHILLA